MLADQEITTDATGTLHIQSVARLTNLSVDTIRAWEKRYAAVTPIRGRAGQRLFSSDDVARLVLLRLAVSGGETISRVASLSTPQLRVLVQAEQDVGNMDDAVIVRLLKRIRALDVQTLSQELLNVGLTNSAVEFADDIIAPLMTEIVRQASSLEESVIQQLFVCEALHSVIGLLFARYSPKTAHPILFLTLPGEKHMLPPLLAALVCAESGKQALYVGTEISPFHIPKLVSDLKADGLGIFFGVHADQNIKMLNEVRRSVGSTPIYVGGDGARYSDVGATQNFRSFCAALNADRIPATA